jgi:hypothetical protein
MAVFQSNAASPSRIEKKSFANTNEINFEHSFGSITVKESDSKQIQLEIHYYDGKNDKPVCEISTEKNRLSIKSIVPKNRRNETIKIDYIIAIPRNIALKVELKYGDIKMDDFYGDFNAKLAYSNLIAQALNGAQAVISCKYGIIQIGKAEDLTLATEYSNVKIDALKKLDVKSKYTNYKMNKVQAILPGSSSAYGDFNIGTAGAISMKLKYSDLIIESIETSLDVKCAYSVVKINTASKQLKSINLNGSYSDLTLGLHPELSADFDISLTYGDLIVAKNYNVKYAISEERNNKIKKTGTIGSKSPTAHIVVSNTYADVKIK